MLRMLEFVMQREFGPKRSGVGHVWQTKSAGIQDAVAQLRRRFGRAAFDVVDYWPADPDTIGIARSGEDEACVCILTAGKTEGRFDVEHGGKVYRDCVIQGLEWAVREELGNSGRTGRCR
jgi:hypothetical protein